MLSVSEKSTSFAIDSNCNFIRIIDGEGNGKTGME